MDVFKANELLDAYGSLLTSRQQEILQQYFQEDYSITEIAENLEISRAAVASTIKKGEHQLEAYENAIGLTDLLKKLEAFEALLSKEQAAALQNLLESWKNA